MTVRLRTRPYRFKHQPLGFLFQGCINCDAAAVGDSHFALPGFESGFLDLDRVLSGGNLKGGLCASHILSVNRDVRRIRCGFNNDR